MKITLKFITVLLCLVCSVQISAQIQNQIMEELGTKDFETIVQACEVYFEEHGRGEGSGYKQFQRWVGLNEYRLTENGEIHNYQVDAFFKKRQYMETRSLQKSGNQPHGDWQSKGPFNSVLLTTMGSLDQLGRISCITQDPNDPLILYVGAATGGVWRSNNYGATWSSLSDGLPGLSIQEIVIDPDSPVSNRTIFILTGDRDGNVMRSYGVLKSLDNGKSWFSSLQMDGVPTGLIMDPNNSSILFTHINGELYKTIDKGVSWNFVTALYDVRDIKFKPGSSTTLYVSTNVGCRYSNDAGVTWTLTPWPSVISYVPMSRLAVSENNPNVLYITGESSGQAYIYKSTDSGATFTFRSSIPIETQGIYNFAFAVHPTNENWLHIAGVKIFYSWDGGVSTALMVGGNGQLSGSVHSDHHQVKYLEPSYFGPPVLWSCNDGGVAYFEEGATSWVENVDQLAITQLYGMDVDKRLDRSSPTVLFGSQDNGSQIIVAGQGRKVNGGDGIECVFSRETGNRDIFVTVQEGGIYKRTLFPLSYSTPITPSDPDWVTASSWTTVVFFTMIANHPYNPGYSNNDILLAAQSDVWVNDTDDHLSDDWQKISDFDASSACKAVTGSKFNKCKMAAAFGNELYVLNETSCTWSASMNWINRTDPSMMNGTITDIVFSETNQNTFWVTFGNSFNTKKVLKTTNMGVSWIDVSGSLPDIPIITIETDGKSNNGLYIGTDAGVFYRNDDIGDWIPFDNNLPSVLIFELDYDPIDNQLYAGSYGRGVWRSSEYGSDCVDYYIFSDNQSGTEAHSAYSYIRSSATIDPFSQIRYTANNEVRLTNGFSVSSKNPEDSYFRAYLSDECDNNSLGSTKSAGFYTDPPSIEEELVSEQAEIGLFRLFPNPGTEEVQLSINSIQNTAEKNKIELFNATGQCLRSFYTSFGDLSMNISSLSKGLYLVRVSNGTSYEVQRLIKE